MKPAWLNKKIDLKGSSRVKQILRDLSVETVCERALCPNMGECFCRDEAAFLILGKQCTRSCSFCNIEKGIPLAVDFDEPRRVAHAAKRLGLKHVVITSVTRDDLSDGGARIFADTVVSIRQQSPEAGVEILIPDFKGSNNALRMVAEVSPDIIAHNVETVSSLYARVRPRAEYQRSLAVLRIIKKQAPEIKTKSGIMLGMGESDQEVQALMKDLRSVGCDFLSIGQYLSPSRRHYPVQSYVDPKQFDQYKHKGMALGFGHIESAPYVRSSYRAGAYLAEEKEKKGEDVFF